MSAKLKENNVLSKLYPVLQIKTRGKQYRLKYGGLLQAISSGSKLLANSAFFISGASSVRHTKYPNIRSGLRFIGLYN